MREAQVFISCGQKTLREKNFTITDDPLRPKSDWYHINVLNRHKNKYAQECLGYVTRIKNMSDGSEIQIPTNELMWAGIGDISVNIMAGSNCELDAFHIIL